MQLILQFMIKNELMVSVIMLTYNHEKYIKQAIEGALMQETDFDFDLIIADDCSTDLTNEIVAEIIKNHSRGSKIKYFRHEKNIGVKENGLFGLSKCEGKYIALCEGDDYWTDPLKLQKQVDFLRLNIEYSFVFTPSQVLNQSTNTIIGLRNKYNNFKSDEFELDDVLKLGGAFYPTNTALFDSEIIDKNTVSYIKLCAAGDYVIAILAALNGKIGYIDDVTGVYRIQNNSLSNKLYDNCEECSNDAIYKYNNNITFLVYFFKKVQLTMTLRQYLLRKEEYTLLSKYLDCGRLFNIFRDIPFKKLGFHFTLRLLFKINFVFFFRRKPLRLKKL